MSTKKYKVGDVVFVVPQLTHFAMRRGDKRQGYFATITAVGRRWAHIGNERTPFDVATGHSNRRQRVRKGNGLGYDVFDSREQWERFELERKAKESLRDRLHSCNIASMIKSLTHDQVNRITAILDEARE